MRCRSVLAERAGQAAGAALEQAVVGLNLFVSGYYQAARVKGTVGYYHAPLGRLDPAVAALIGHANTERRGWASLSEDSLARVWDNDEDARYDDWAGLYGAPAR